MPNLFAEKHCGIHMPELAPVGEKRTWVRFPTSLFAVCWLGDPESSSSWTSRVHDISTGGLCFFHAQGLAPGTAIHLVLQSNGVSLTSTLEAQVVHARLEESGSWLMGCRFSSELSDRERRILL
jgi:hypothetical protein